jgi:Flp pilus assembly protein TadG
VERTPRQARPPLERDAGAVAVTVAMLGVALLLVVGMVFEGGTAIAAKRRAMNVAEQAARAGAEQVDIARLRAGGEFVVDPAAAQAAASAFLGAAGYSGSVSVEGATVTVRGVAWSSPSPVLGAVGVGLGGTVPAAHARNLHGIVVEEP